MIMLFLYQTINCLLISAQFLLRGTCFKHQYTETPQNWETWHLTSKSSLKHWFVFGKMEFFAAQIFANCICCRSLSCQRETITADSNCLSLQRWFPGWREIKQETQLSGELPARANLQGVGGTFLKREEMAQRWSSEALRASVGP